MPVHVKIFHSWFELLLTDTEATVPSDLLSVAPECNGNFYALLMQLDDTLEKKHFVLSTTKFEHGGSKRESELYFSLSVYRGG